MMALCINADAQSRQTKSSLRKENQELHRQIDSLIQDMEEFKAKHFAEDSLVSEMLGIYDENDKRGFEHDQAVTDSLLSIWYVHRQVGQLDDEEEVYDLDSVRFTSDVPDSVLIERLLKMNSYITLPFNENVKSYMILYSERLTKRMEHILGLSSYYMPIFEATFNKYGIPEELKYMAIIESALNPVAVSRAGAKGMWQFMHNTGKSYGLKINSFVDERMDVEKAADAAARYLLDSYNIFGDWCLAISSYNCGAGNVNKAIKRAGGKTDFWSIYPYLPKETRGYMPAFVGAMYAMTYYKEYGITPDPIQMPAYTDTFEIHKNLHFQQVSDLVGIPMEELKNLNPQYIKDIVPGNEDTYILKLPYNYTSSFLEHQDSLYTYKAEVLLDNKVASGKTTTSSSSTSSQDRIAYKVKNGDYLGKIASRYGVSVSQLKSWNHLRSDRLSIGQTLYIYGKSASTSSTQKSSSSSSTSSSSSGYTTYTVKSGDSIYKIAQKYPGVTADQIMKYNGISSSIKPGMKLKIPTK